MSDDRRQQVGLSRRELERELNWLLRTLPADPEKLAKLLGQVLVTLIDKNNAAIAKSVSAEDEGKPGAP